MITLQYEQLAAPDVLKQSQSLNQTGTLAQTKSGLVYVKIADAYIHQLYPLLRKQFTNATKPQYFGQVGIGAHISVAYPNEKPTISKEELGKEIEFAIESVIRARIVDKYYYVLLVNAPSLLELRKQHGLSEKLDFKGYAIDPHITIANEK